MRAHLWLLTLVLVGCEGSLSFIDDAAGEQDRETRSPPGTLPPPACTPTAAGHYTLRRLTNREFTNTVQDLLFTTARPGDALQETPVGSSGYTNDSFALSISPALISALYDQAVPLAREVIASKGRSGGAYSKLVTCDSTQAACRESTVRQLARRALRRPLTSDDVDALLGVFNGGGTFDQGLNDLIVSLLIHPEFLFIPVVDDASLDPKKQFALDDHELAARLSYFLWQSMPDDELSAKADAQTLQDPATLDAQVRRMLRDSRASKLKDVLRDEFAELGALARKDFTQIGQRNTLRDAMIGETDAFFADLLAHDRSPLLILTSEQTFANKTLADFYGLTFPAGTPATTFVPLAAGRTGLGAHGSVLTNTSGGSATFTHPIKRGHWFASKLFCAEPPPPPGNIPPLPAVSQQNATIRQRLAAHVNQPSCQGCHVTMDNFGLGAENYDAFGRWRLTYADSTAVDATGTYPDGTSFQNSKDLFRALGAQPQARACVAQQFLKLAVSRALKSDDVCAATGIAEVTVTEGATFSDLVVRVAQSTQFTQQTGEAP